MYVGLWVAFWLTLIEGLRIEHGPCVLAFSQQADSGFAGSSNLEWILLDAHLVWDF